jgi:hypothetical protein
MEVLWVYAEESLPPKGEWDCSRQVVIRTRDGYLNTGYFNYRTLRWETDGLLLSKDYVQLWLRGLE